MMTHKEEAHSKAVELHSRYSQAVAEAARKSVEGVLAQRPDSDEKELSARRWAGLRVVLLDAGFSYDEAVVLAKALALLTVSGLWPQDENAVLALAHEKLVGAPPRPDANTYGIMLLLRKLSARLNGSVYDSHETAVLSISRRLRAFIAQCVAQGVAREDVAKDIAAAAELTPEMVYRVETAGKRITAPMLLRLDRALRRAEMEAANG